MRSVLRALIVGAVFGLAACAVPAGAEGPAGPAGPAGPPGMDGAAGNGGGGSLAVEYSVLCLGRVIGSTGALSIRLHLIAYTNGDFIATCSVSNGFTTSSGSNYFIVTDSTGTALPGACVVGMDDDGTFGRWVFGQPSLGNFEAVYMDDGSENDGFTVAFDSPPESIATGTNACLIQTPKGA